MKANALPIPDEAAIKHSLKLIEHIKQLINNGDGKISFTDYMQACLYAPGLGYYAAGSEKFAKHGDFITAPELSDLFGKCIAAQCKQILDTGLKDILEFGAGSGKLATDILLELEKQNTLPEHYFILEISADLKQRQQQHLQEKLPQLFERVVWLETLPENFNGIMLANEVLDAMPIHRFHFCKNQLQEYYVGFADNRFRWITDQPSQNLLDVENDLRDSLATNTENYSSEINLLAKPWLNSLYHSMQKGVVLLIDYGFNAVEFFHPQRCEGTLMCHYRHHAHPDPFVYPGLNDITAHVNFTQIAEFADAADFDVSGFIQQANLLLNLSITHFAQTENLKQQLEYNRALKILTLQHEMGMLFKALLLTKNYDDELIGFKQSDELHRL